MCSEDSPALGRASNHGLESAQAAREAGFRAVAGAAWGEKLAALVGAAVRSFRMERGFVLSSGPAGDGRSFVVEAALSARRDGERSPSRSLARRVLARPGPSTVIEPRRGAVSPSASVRGLGLRAALAATVAAPLVDTPNRRVALLLDSRHAGACAGATATVGPVLEDLARLAAALLEPAGERPADARSALPAGRGLPGLVGRSARWRRVVRRVERSAATSLPVLIRGETGTGKERLAHALHLLSPRRAAPWVPVNCAALAETLLESELFGVVRGAYTGADRDRPGLFRAADGGTLFLDEIGDMPLSMQAKLLRALEEHRIRPLGGDEEVAVDVRVVAATHRDLRGEVRAGRFRQDLLYRVAVLEVRVPPLRLRPDDLESIGTHLLERLAVPCGGRRARLERCALERLRRHDWPGNVRELRAVLARALLAARDGVIRAVDLALDAPAPRVDESPGDLERQMLLDAVQHSGGNLARAAARIGWTRQKLYRRMAALGVERPERY
jgi:two-component system response regulator PilR (NtrC family)